MNINQISLNSNVQKKIIHLDLYVDESKKRPYKTYMKNENITYIMILAIPSNKKMKLYNKLNNSRCIQNRPFFSENCTKKCPYHSKNDKELHFTEIKSETDKIIAKRWIDTLLNDDLQNQENIYFNILGIIESNLDFKLFGNEKQEGNIYCRFFRTCLLRLLRMFDKYDQVIIDNIYHDRTNEMENHPYFNTSAIKKISMEQLNDNKNRFIFEKRKIEFLDSNHHKGKQIDSQFIQFVDIVLGATLNTIHHSTNNANKEEISYKIRPLIEQMVSDNVYKKKNSLYNFFNKQCISFFPILSKTEIKKETKKLYKNEVDIDSLLKNADLFSNSIELLLPDIEGQMSLFN